MLSVESCSRCRVCFETHASNHASGTDPCSGVAVRLLAFDLAVWGQNLIQPTPTTTPWVVDLTAFPHAQIQAVLQAGGHNPGGGVEEIQDLTMNLPSLPELGVTKLTTLPLKAPVAAVQHATTNVQAPCKLDSRTSPQHTTLFCCGDVLTRSCQFRRTEPSAGPGASLNVQPSPVQHAAVRHPIATSLAQT